MRTGHLLLVAPDSELRRSLVFALSTDGYILNVLDEPPALSWFAMNRFDCTIVDQKVFDASEQDSLEFCDTAQPVVLLASHAPEYLADHVAEIELLPLGVGSVNAAVRRALGVPVEV